MIINILTDNSKSWFVSFGRTLEQRLTEAGHQVSYVFDKKYITHGDICFLLSCTRLIAPKYLKLNEHNIVVHASDLPAGKGFSPLQWQVLEGRDQIPLTLFEVVEKVDSGPYYLKDQIELDGTELYAEMREKLGNKIIEMCIVYVKDANRLSPIKQIGEETFYRRRTENDDCISINNTIRELFNHFRIADNDNHPLFFEYLGQQYTIKVEKRVKSE